MKTCRFSLIFVPEGGENAPRRHPKSTKNASQKQVGKNAKKQRYADWIGWMDGWIADTIEADLRPAGTHFRTAKIRRTLQEAEKVGPISSTQIPLRRSYT